MGALTLGLALPALVAVVPATADPVERWRPIVAEAARRTGLPEAWIRRDPWRPRKRLFDPHT